MVLYDICVGSYYGTDRKSMDLITMSIYCTERDTLSRFKSGHIDIVYSMTISTSLHR